MLTPVFRPRAVVLALAAAFSGAVAAAEPTQPQSLEEVVVSEPRIYPLPASSALDGGQITRMRPATSDTANLLGDVPGVSLYGAGGVSSLPAIHGLADDRNRIKVDGMDWVASCPNHMNPPLSYIDPSHIGSIRVFAGITPVSVGGDSIGGSIIVKSRAPRFAQPGETLATGEIGAFYRSNGEAFGGNISATLANDKLSLTYEGATAQSDNTRAGGDFRPDTPQGRASGRIGHALALDEIASTAYKTQNHTLGLAFRSANQLFEAKLGFQNIPYEFYPNQRMDMLDNKQERLNLRYLGQWGWGSLEARAYHENVRHHMDFGDDKRFWYGMLSMVPGQPWHARPCAPTGPTCAAGMPMDTRSKTTGVSLTASVDLNPESVVRTGAEWQRYQLDDWWPPSGGGMWPGDFWNIHDGQRSRTALFAEWEARLNPQWMALLGARYEHVTTNAGDVRGYSIVPGVGSFGMSNADARAFNARDRKRTDNNWDITALARYSPSSTLDLEFGFAHKTRSPNLYERYTWSRWPMAAVMNNFVGDGNGYFGDIGLKPEKANTVSATFDVHAADRAWEFKATPYYTRVTDYIDAVPRMNIGLPFFRVLQHTNQSARLWGLDLSGKLPLAKTGVGAFGLEGMLGYTHGKNLETGNPLYNIMPLNAKIRLTHQLGGWDNALEWVGVEGKHRVASARNEIRTQGYGLVNLRSSYSWRTVRVDFGVDNLFDKFYRLPLGGAYTAQGTTMSINGIPFGVAVPGMGRSIYTGINVKF